MNGARIISMFGKELDNLMNEKSITKMVPIHKGVIENMEKDKYQESASIAINAIYNSMYDKDNASLKRMIINAIIEILEISTKII